MATAYKMSYTIQILMANYLSTQPYKGTRDFYPEDMRIRLWMFETMRKVALTYGFEEYDGPMLEAFELYAAKTGEEIVNQQLYHFMDRGERKVAIRPEMTPTLARMVAGKVHELPKPVRWFSFPNLWRYERPQRGRLREHWQLNVDILGGDSVLADSEILSLALEIVRRFGGSSFVQVRVNHRKIIESFFKEHLGLTAEVGLAASKAIDARSKIGEEKYSEWLKEIGLSSPQISSMEKFFASNFQQVCKDFPSEASKELEKLFSLLSAQGLGSQIVFDPKVMRGMDYYTGVVFEMYDTSPENPRAIFGGGRYDNLVGMFGNQALSGVGLGLGDVTLRNFLETHSLIPNLKRSDLIFLGWTDQRMQEQGTKISADLRKAGLPVITPLGEEGIGNLLKSASKHGCRWAILMGDEEFQKQSVAVKDLEARSQVIVLQSKLLEHMKGMHHGKN